MKILKYTLLGVMWVLIGVLVGLAFVNQYMIHKQVPVSSFEPLGEELELNKLCRSNGVMWLSASPCGFMVSVGDSKHYEDGSIDLQPTIRIKQLQGSKEQ